MLIDKGQAVKYSSEDFLPDFIKDLKHDFNLLSKIEEMWKEVNDDPKLDEFVKHLSEEKVLRENKLLVFTESRETAEYLHGKLSSKVRK